MAGEGGQGLEELLVGWMRPRVVDRITALALREAGAELGHRPLGERGAGEVGEAEPVNAISGGLRRGQFRS